MSNNSSAYNSDNEDPVDTVNSINSDEYFLRTLDEITSVDRDNISSILKSTMMIKNPDAKLRFQQQLRIIHAYDNGDNSRDLSYLRQYLETVKKLFPIVEKPSPITPKKIFVMEHTSDHFDNIAIKMMNMVVGTDCHVVQCLENVNEGAYFGYKNKFDLTEPSIGAVMRGVFACDNTQGMMVFMHAEHMLTHSGIINLVSREHRKKFEDKYLDFPVDLSKFTFLFFVNSFDSIPPHLRDHFHKMEYTWIHVVNISKKSDSKASIRDNDSVIASEF